MFDSYAYVFALSISLVVIISTFVFYYKKAYKKKVNVSNKKNKPKIVTGADRKSPMLSITNRQKLRVQNRMEYSEDVVAPQNEDFDKSENTEKRIGIKKARKLEEKKLKKEQREIEEREREIRKAQEEELAAKLKCEKEMEEKLNLEMEAKLEMEKIEKEKMELEIYEKLKIDFEIENEGIEEVNDMEKEKKLDDEIINYLISKKTVMVEELAGHFNLKTQTSVSKIKEYLKLELITGVIDDRGRFIHITTDEYAKVVKFILQRGRIHIKEMVENSDKLVKLY